MIGNWGRGAATLLALWCWALFASPARAGELVAAGSHPIVNVQLSGGTLDVRTWDRPEVDIQAHGQVSVRRIASAIVARRYHPQIAIPSQSVATPRGTVTLGEEPFVLPKLPGTQHQAVVARGQGDTTVFVPKGTALVVARDLRGTVNLSDYHGVFLVHTRTGSIHLTHVSGTGFVESLRGPIVATDSTFDRLRARTATGNLHFDRCISNQIEASSDYGSILYDDGSFKPGMARFESRFGNVALGVRGEAQIGAHSAAGHVISDYARGRRARGPVVTATTQHGNVYLFHGSIRRARAPLPRPVPRYRRLPARTQPPPQYYAPQYYAPQPMRYPERAPRYAPPQPPRQPPPPPAPRQAPHERRRPPR